MRRGACVRACVWTLVCVCVARTATLEYDTFVSEGDYADDTASIANTTEYSSPWNYVMQLLFGNDTDEPWREGFDVEVKNLNLTNTLKGLSDNEIWNTVTNGEGDEIMNDEAPRSEDESGIEEKQSLEEHQKDSTKNNDSSNGLLPTSESNPGGYSSDKKGQELVKDSSTLDREAQEKMLDGLLDGSEPEVQSDSAAGPKDAEGSSTLAFVFDTTGSMWDDLVQVRHGAAKIMETMLERPDKPIADYVLVPFHDPLVGPATVTTDHKLLMQKLYEIQIYGGGDCPEASVEAVLQALQLSRPNSYIYVFTDARSKDYHLINQVLPLIQRKQSQVVFVMTGDCGDQTHPGYQVYHKIAATSSGQVYHLNKTDVDEVLSFVRVSLQSRKVNLLSVERPAAHHAAELPLPIDQSLKEFTVSVSGSNASIGVVNPVGEMVHPPQLTPLLDLQHVKVVNVKEPPPGMWTLHVGSDSQHTVRSTGLSGSDFIHGFSVIPTTNMAETYHRPLKSGFNSVLIRATEPDTLYNFTQLELVLLNGTVVQTIPLWAVPDHPGLYSGGPFMPPDEFFYLGIHGYGTNNFPVKRITATAISAQPPELPTVSIATSYTGQVGKPLTLICRVESLVPFVVRWYKDGAIKTKSIKYNQTAAVPLAIESVKSEDAGRYICKVQIPNIPGSVIKDTRVKVTVPPAQVVTSREVTAWPGALVELPCAVTSLGPYNVSWYRLNTRPTSGYDGKTAALDELSNSPDVVISSNNSLLLTSPDTLDEGWYICTAHNQGGQTSGRVHLSVQQAPAVRVSPTHQEYTVGSSVHLQCQVTAGIPYPAVSWTKDNVPVQGDDEPNDNTQWVLRLRNLQKDDEGIYICEAKNVVGIAQGSAELTLLEPPQVRAETDSQLVRLGDSVTLRCLVEGVPSPQITWYKDQTLLSDNLHPRIQILKSGSLEVYNASIKDSGRYTCVARNKVGTAKDFTDLEIGSAPLVLHLPSDLEVPIGGSASVLCAAIGNPVPFVTWSRAGKSLESSRMFTTVQGELSIQEAEKEDEGEYTCTVENIFGKSTYRINVKVTGIVAPRLMLGSLPSDTKALLGRSIQLPCPVTAGNPPPSRQWFKDGVPLDGNYFQIGSDGSLWLNNVSRTDEGSYECVVSNVGGRDSFTTTVDVMVSPRIKASERDGELRAVEGSPVTLTCSVTGDPPPSVSWLHNGKRIFFSGQNQTSLQLRNVTTLQAGTYTCLAESPAGHDSASTMLHVLVPPKIKEWKENVTVNEAYFARLECYVLSNPPSNISWYYERTLLPYHSSVIRFQANKSAEGQYKCVAENEVGSTTKLVNLFVSVVPRIDPLAVTKLLGVAGEEVRLQCPATGEPKPIISWRKLGSLISRQVNEDGSVVLKNLTPADAGTYVCSATNVAGSAMLPVSLDVLVRPVIVGWEGEVSVLEGEALSVVCEVEGDPAPSVLWLRDSRHHANGSTLTFVAKREDAGSYSCVAENQVGVDEQKLSLTVIVPARILGREEESVRLFGNTSETQLVCQVDGIPAPLVSWVKDTVILANSNDKRIRIKGNTLVIANATEELAGTYICQAENIAGIAQKIFETEFYEPPRILDVSPTTITLREGDDYTIPCTAAGVPAPEVGWRAGLLNLLPGFQNDELVVMKDNLLVLTQVTVASEGVYQCHAHSAAGQAHRNYSVRVVVPPSTMNSSVTRVEVVDSNDGLLSCPVTPGSSNPTIQWLKDGVPISFDVNERADDTHYILKDGSRTLKIVEARPEDSGLYTCIATNLAGRSQAEFDVNVLEHPLFFDDFPQTEFDKAEGERVEFDCSVEGNPEPKVSWKRVEQNLPVSQHTSPGVMLELPHRWRLVIPSVRPHHAGTYQCTATNRLGRATRTFTLRVTAPPELDGAREETIDAIGEERLALQCRVWGTPVPTITWEYSETDTSDFHKTKSEGEDSRVLERSARPGLYRCTAANPLGSVSKLFNVTVSEPPVIERSELVEEIRVKLGSDAVLTCDVHGRPTPTVTWLHNGHVLTDSPGPRLTLGPITPRSGGKYACVASNKAGVAEKTFKVKVLVAPRLSDTQHFSADPQLSVLEGLPLTLRCPVTGTPPPAIAWVKDGADQEVEGELLTVGAATRDDAGNYTCIATNHVGNVSKTFMVVVHSAPQFQGMEPVQQIEVVSKSRLRLDCSVSAQPPPSIVWLRGSDPVNLSLAFLSSNNQTLTIESVGLEQSGQYSCIASNIAGAAEKTFDVNVLEPPSLMGDEAAGNTSAPPTPLRAVLHRKVVLECPVAGTPQPNITWYKDGEVLWDHQTSMEGRLLHIMSVVIRHGGNYSCRAENQAGSTQLFLPLTVVVPLQWSEWTKWTSCSKSCGGGMESRERQCGHKTNTSSAFVEFDTSDCVGEQVQSRPCNVLPCQIHGSWSEWTAWTSCSESCGHGTRRRYRRCDSPAPALGGDPCLGSDGQQEPCIIQPCPLQSQWSEWTAWSACTAKCGVGTKFRARQCVRGDEVADDCDGPNQQVNKCSNRKCPVDGKWTMWGPWSSCSVSCGRGLRQRHRICSRRLYGGKPCFGDNIEIEKCLMAECEAPAATTTRAAPEAASLRIRGQVNGRRVDDMYLDAHIQQDGPRRRVTATLRDILKAQASWFPYLTFLMPPMPWNPSARKEKYNVGYPRNSGNFTEESRFQFATGEELLVKHVGKGVDQKGALKVDIEVVGEVPLVQPTSEVIVDPYSEDYVKTSPNTMYTSSRSALEVDGERVPFQWNRTVIFDDSRDTVPHLVERLSTDEVASKYNPENDQFDFEVSSKISKKYHNNKCPIGFRLDPQYHHCSDIDECKEIKKPCQPSQVCENQFGSYRCQCQSGFRLSANGVKCIDINECVEEKPCSHSCHNTRGSFYCSCPPQLALSHSGLTCKAWGELDMEEPVDDEYVEEDLDSNYQFLEAPEEYAIGCKPGLVWRNNDCIDIDECSNVEVCGEEETCMNTHGSFHCLRTTCVDSNWDAFSRSCIRVCEEWRDGCAGDALVAEFVRHLPLTLASTTLQPYQELATLRPLGLHDEQLTRNVFYITSNEQDVPLRIRIEKGEGILYAMKYFEINGIYRVTIKASSYSKDYKTELYTTHFVVFLYAEEN